MPEHFNNAVGRYVNNSRELKDEFKIASENAYIRTGLEADYQPIDPSDFRDASSHGVTEEGLDTTYKALRDSK
jgi:hypothetical protein